MKNQESIVKRMLKGIGYGIISEIMCVIVCIMMLMLMRRAIIIKVIVALCTAAITLGMYFNWAFYSAKRDIDRVKFRDGKYDRMMPFKMALFAPLPSYVMLVILYLAKSGLFSVNNFFGIYLMGNMWLTPFVAMFTDSRNITDITAFGITGITFLILLQPITIILTYILTYNNIDLYKIIFIKNDKNKS